jgi:hypothetical protein
MDTARLHHVRTEVAARHQAGQIAVYDGPDAVVSPIGAVPKGSTKFRTIHHLSYPRSGASPSVNEGIIETSLQFETLDTLFDTVAKGTDLQIWKVDLQDAFRHCPVASSDRRLLCFRVDDVTYADLTLPFGLKSSPFLFNLVAEVLHWCMERIGLPLSHYLDDFFGASPAAAEAVTLLSDLARALGLQVNPSKCCHGPTVEVLGIVVDAPRRTASISEERRRTILLVLDDILARRTASLLELQQVAGTLVFVTRVCPTGRAFLRRLFDALAAAPLGGSRRRIPTAALADLRWWRTCLTRWDGVSVLRPPRASVSVTTDASGTKGAGGWVSQEGAPGSSPVAGACADVFSTRLPRRHREKDIVFKEAWAVLFAVRRWTSRLAGRHVTFYVDNSALAYALRSGSIRHRSTQAVVRELFVLALENRFTFRVEWLASGDNGLADALSRFDLERIRRIAPMMVPATRSAALHPTSHSSRASSVSSADTTTSRPDSPRSAHRGPAFGPRRLSIPGGLAQSVQP